MVRSILAVLAGFVLWTVFFLGGNQLLLLLLPSAFNEDGTTDNNLLLALLLLLTVVYSLLSGLLTARIAASNAPFHGLILGALLLAVGIIVQIQFWNVLPIWYNLAFLILLLPSAWIGSRLVS